MSGRQQAVVSTHLRGDMAFKRGRVVLAVTVKLAGWLLLAIIVVWLGWGIWRVQAAYRIAGGAMGRDPHMELPANYVEKYYLRIFAPIVLQIWLFLSVTWFCITRVLRPELRRLRRRRLRSP